MINSMLKIWLVGTQMASSVFPEPEWTNNVLRELYGI
jgi:hypothetical protein